MNENGLADMIKGVLNSDVQRGIVYNRIAALDGSAAETLRAVRAVRTDAMAESAKLKAQIAHLQAEKTKHDRVVVRADEAAMDVLREQRETYGPMSEVGMYKLDLGDGTFVSLIVSPTTAVVCTPDAGEKLYEAGLVDLVKIEYTPKKDVIKAFMKIDREREFPGCVLVDKTYNSDPQADENVQWSKPGK
jgi:hypothetical protein